MKLKLLSIIFNKLVQLELIRLQYPFYDPNIIVNLLAYFSETMKIRWLLKNISQYTPLIKSPANLQRKRFSVILRVTLLSGREIALNLKKRLKYLNNLCSDIWL